MTTERQSTKNIGDDEDTCRTLLLDSSEAPVVPAASGSSRVLLLPAISSDDAERVLEVDDLPRPARARWLYGILILLLVLGAIAAASGALGLLRG